MFSQLKLGNIWEYSLICKTVCVVKKNWRIINTIASIWGKNMLGWYFVFRHLFLEAHSFPWATLSENCLLLGTDNVRRQISQHILCQMEVTLSYSSIFKTVCFENDLNNNKQNSHRLAWKYAGIFVLGHNLFLKVRSQKTVPFLEQIISADIYPSIIYFRAKWRLLFMYSSPSMGILWTQNVTSSQMAW